MWRSAFELNRSALEVTRSIGNCAGPEVWEALKECDQKLSNILKGFVRRKFKSFEVGTKYSRHEHQYEISTGNGIKIPEMPEGKRLFYSRSWN